MTAPKKAPARCPKGAGEPDTSLGRDRGILTSATASSKTEQVPGLVTLAGAASLVGLSRSTFDAWDRAEFSPRPAVLSGRRYWSKDELRAWMAWGCPTRAAWSRTWPRVRRELLDVQQVR